MPHKVALSNSQLSQLESTGVLKLPGLLDRAAVTRAREAVLAPLNRLGLWRDGNWRLDARPTPKWPDQGLKPARDIGHRHPEVEALIRQPAIEAVVDQLLAGAEVDRTVYPRPQVLASLPNALPWALPNGWHTDMPRLAKGGSPGIQAFMFLDSVEPHGGGPLVVAGSHRLFDGGRDMRVNEITSTLRREPFFDRLFTGGDAEGSGVLPVGRVGDVRLEVVELAGEPGDVFLMDLRALHAAAPNGSKYPRLMATHRFVRADRMREIARAFGWE